MSEGFNDIESQQMSMPQSISRSKSHFSTLKTTVINYHKCLFISGFIFIATFIAIYQHNQIESETEEFDFSAFALKSDDPMPTRNLMSASNDIIKAATFNFGGPNASPFEYYPSEGEVWYPTFKAINDHVNDTLADMNLKIMDILPEDDRTSKLMAADPSIEAMLTKPIGEIMKEAQIWIEEPKEFPYESRIFSVLGRLDRYTWLKQDEKYPTGNTCREDLLKNGAQWQYMNWNQKWEETWKHLKNDNQKFDSGKFLENSKLSDWFTGNPDLIKQFAIIMLKTFDKICWDAAVMAFQNAQRQDPNPVSVMFQTAFKGGEDILKLKIELLQTVAAEHHVTFVHEGTELQQQYFPEAHYHVAKSKSKVGTPSLIIFNKNKFANFDGKRAIGYEIVKADGYPTTTKEELNNEFVAVKYHDGQYGDIMFASFHAASSPKKPNTAIDKMTFLESFGFPIIAGMDCNQEIFKKGGYSGTAYPAESGSMTTNKKRSHVQEQQGKADELDSKQKDEIFYQKVEMVKGSVLTEIALREINPDPEEEAIIPNPKMPIDHFIVSADFKITTKQ